MVARIMLSVGGCDPADFPDFQIEMTQRKENSLQGHPYPEPEIMLGKRNSIKKLGPDRHVH